MAAASHVSASQGLCWMACNPAAASLLHGTLTTLVEALAGCQGRENLQDVTGMLLVMQATRSPLLQPGLNGNLAVDPLLTGLNFHCGSKTTSACTEAIAALVALQKASCSDLADRNTADGDSSVRQAIRLAQVAHALHGASHSPGENSIASALAMQASAAFASPVTTAIAAVCGHHEGPDDSCTAAQGVVCAYLAARDALSYSEHALLGPHDASSVSTGSSSGASEAAGSERWIRLYQMTHASLHCTQLGLALGQGVSARRAAAGCDYCADGVHARACTPPFTVPLPPGDSGQHGMSAPPCKWQIAPAHMFTVMPGQQP
jgi:hypothetical protein